MDKFERLNAVRNMNAPDYMPVSPNATSQIILSMGWSLCDVIGTDWYDSDKCATAVLWSLKNIDYDIVLPAYVDSTFGTIAAGGRISKGVGSPDSDTFCTEKLVKAACDWPKVQRQLARASVAYSDPRMSGALETIRTVALQADNTVPLVATGYLGATAAMLLFRSSELLVSDMINRSDFAWDMCRTATDWTMDWIRAQYQAGANSVTYLIDTMGTMAMSPMMGERFNIPCLSLMVETIRKEFDQGVWLYIYGNMKTKMGYKYLQKIIEQVGIEGIHLDDSHSPQWVKENVIDRFKIPACISFNSHRIAAGPAAKIKTMVQNSMSTIGDGLGIMMAPCYQVLSHTPNEHFKAWVAATHEHGVYPLQSAD